MPKIIVRSLPFVALLGLWNATAKAQETAEPLPALAVEEQREVERNGVTEGYVPRNAVSASKTNTPLIEIPLTVNVITAQQIADQHAQSISEALRYTPGVSVDNFGALSPTDSYTRIRGFRADQYLDGTRLPIKGDGAGSFAIEPYGMERIEVLKGPASTLYGSAAPGGLINMVSKQPRPGMINEVQAQTGSFDRAQFAFDVGGSITPDDELMVRLTGLARDADTQVDYAEDNRLFIAPAITWAPDDYTRLTLLGHYSQEKSDWPFFNLMPPKGTLFDSPNGRIDRSTNTGEPDYDKLDRYQYAVGYMFEHDFNDDITLRQNLRYGEIDSRVDAVANIFGFFFTADNRTTTRVPISVHDQVDVLTVDNQLNARFDTGPLEHEALFGVDYRLENAKRLFLQGGPLFLDIYDPNYGQPFADPSVVAEDSKFRESQVGIYLQDQLNFGNLHLQGGLRYDWADTRTVSHNTDQRVTQNDEALSGQVGLSYTFDMGLAPYASYSTSFQPVSGVDGNGNAFKPTTGEQFEVGIKYQPPGTESLFTLSAFDITQQNVRTADLFGFARQTGEVNVRGIEFEARTAITEEFSIIGSYAYLDAEITKSERESEVGQRPAETADHQASLWAQYNFAHGTFDGLRLGGGVRYVGETEDDSHTLDIPDYVLFDASLAYDVGAVIPMLKGMELSVAGTNLADEYYVTGCFGQFATACALGAGRTIYGTVSYRW